MTAWGFHYSTGGNKTGSGAFIQRLNAAGIPVMMKGASDAGLCFEAQEKGKQYGVENILIWRATSDREDRADYWLAPSVAAAKKWGEIKNLWPPELDKNLVWWEVINEPRKEDAPDEVQPTWGNMHTTAWLGLFMVEMAKLMIPAGHKLCGPSFSSGEPEPEDWQLDGMATWLRYCADNPDKAAVSHHEYDNGFVGFEACYPWHYGRFQSIIAAADRLGIPRTFSIFITEFGWRYDWVPTWEQAQPTLAEYNALCANFPQVKGIALWTLQDGWGGISDRLAAWIATDGNPFANWVINNQLQPATQPQPTAPEFGATLPQQPPDGGGGTVTTEIKSTVTYGLIEGRIKVRPQKWDGELKNWVATGPAIYLDLPAGTRRIAIDDEVEVDEPTDPNPPQPKPYLEVEALGQRDPAWANVTLGQPTGHGKTIGNWGCLLVAYNCLARYWGLTTRLPAAENAHYVSAGAFSAQYIQPAALRTAYPNSVAYDGYLTRDSDAMRGKIRQWIDDGWPVPCRVDFNPATGQWEQHWVLVVGYMGDTDFYMMDPWHGDIAVVNDRYSITGSDILEAIFYRPEEGDPPTPPPPAGQTYDTSFMRGEPGIWRVIRRGDGSSEDVWELPLDSQNDVRVKNTSEGEWYFYGLGGVWRKRDTSPAPDPVTGQARLYVFNEGGQIAPNEAQIGVTYSYPNYVQFKAKSNCQNLSTNSGPSTSTFLLKEVIQNYTFPGTGVTVNWLYVTVQTGETQLYAVHNGRTLGWVGGGAQQANNVWAGQLAEVHYDRQIPQQEPPQYCS